jgi:polyhydroxyalkanoate synthase
MSADDTSSPAADAAALDVLLADAALGPVRRLVPDLSTMKWAMSLARRPRNTAGRFGELGAEVGRIMTGTSTVAPSRGDRRFTDVAWTENPLLKRLARLYLAGSHTAQQLVTDAELDWRDRKRVGSSSRTSCRRPRPATCPWSTRPRPRLPSTRQA